MNKQLRASRTCEDMLEVRPNHLNELEYLLVHHHHALVKGAITCATGFRVLPMLQNGVSVLGSRWRVSLFCARFALSRLRLLLFEDRLFRFVRGVKGPEFSAPAFSTRTLPGSDECGGQPSASHQTKQFEQKPKPNLNWTKTSKIPTKQPPVVIPTAQQ